MDAGCAFAALDTNWPLYARFVPNNGEPLSQQGTVYRVRSGEAISARGDLLARLAADAFGLRIGVSDSQDPTRRFGEDGRGPQITLHHVGEHYVRTEPAPGGPLLPGGRPVVGRGQPVAVDTVPIPATPAGMAGGRRVPVVPSDGGLAVVEPPRFRTWGRILGSLARPV